MVRKSEKYYKGLFFVAALYDIVLGLGFLFFYKLVYSILKVPLPTSPAYISLSAAFVFVIGIGYYLIYLDLKSNRDLVKLGILYKFAYAGIALYYFVLGTLPHNLFLVLAIMDLVFAGLFIEFLEKKRKDFIH